jgi:hypothetical protein
MTIFLMIVHLLMPNPPRGSFIVSLRSNPITLVLRIFAHGVRRMLVNSPLLV